MSINLDIWLALRHRLSSLDLSSPVWPQWGLALEGEDYAPVSGQPFFAVAKINMLPTRALINRNVNDREGTFIVTPVMPIGQHAEVYQEAAGLVAEHFQGCIRYRGKTLWLESSAGGVAYATSGYRDGGWNRFPVTVPWKTWR